MLANRSAAHGLHAFHVASQQVFAKHALTDHAGGTKNQDIYQIIPPHE